MIPWAALLLAGSSASLQSVAHRHLAASFAARALPPPASSSAVARAAAALAKLALIQGPGVRQQGLMEEPELWEPVGHQLVIVGGAEAVQEKLLTHRFEKVDATHFGAAVQEDGKQTALVLLFIDRKAQLQPFPRRLSGPGKAETLCGELREPLGRASVHLTRPGGQVEEAPLATSAGARFCAALSFPLEGLHTVEVLGHGPRGPEVAALFPVQVGKPRPVSVAPAEQEPADEATARAALTRRLASLRKNRGLPPLREHPVLQRVAQLHADRMVAEGFFGHVSPDGENLGGRLAKTGFAHEAAGENLAAEDGVLAAQQSLENSPGHLANLINPRFEEWGLGLVWGTPGQTPRVTVVQVFARPQRTGRDESEESHRAVAQLRQGLKLPALRRSPPLDALALDAARKAASSGAVAPGTQRRLEDAARERVSSDLVTTEILTGSSPSALQSSRGVRAPHHDAVGAAALRDREGRYWVVLVFADLPEG